MDVGKADLDGASHDSVNGTSLVEVKQKCCLQTDRLLTEQTRILCKLLRTQSRSVKATDMIKLHESPDRIYRCASFTTSLNLQGQQKILGSWQQQYTPSQEASQQLARSSDDYKHGTWETASGLCKVLCWEQYTVSCGSTVAETKP
jgi:hypothetical protein